MGSTLRIRKECSLLLAFLILGIVSLFSQNTYAQNGAPCYQPLIGPGTQASAVQNGTLQVNAGLFSPLSNITDGNTANFASNQTVLGVLNQTGVSVMSDQAFPAGWRAGYVVEFTGGLLTADVLGAISIQTLNNGTVVDTKTNGSGLGVTLLGASSGKLYLNFASSGQFDEVRLLLNSTVNLNLLANSVRVYYAMAFDPNCGNNENNNICEDQIAGPGTVVSFNGGLLSVLTSLNNRNNIIDGNKNTSAALGLPAGTSILSTPIYVGVTDLFNVYPAGNKAGFVIRANSALLTANVLNNVKIQTYLFGEFVGEATFNDGSGLLALSALSFGANDKKKLEFTSPGKFNEVRIVFGSGIDVNTATTDIFYAYESGPTCSDCRTLLSTDSPSPYTGSIVTGNNFPGCTPVVLVSDCNWTGKFGLLSVANSVSNAANAVSPSQSDFATVDVRVGALGAGARLTIQTNGLQPANSFAGFEIARENGGLLGLLDVSALDAITIRAFNGTTEVGSQSAASLLNAGVLSGTGGKTVLGFKPTAQYNRLVFEVSSGLLTAATSYRVYNAFVILDTDGDGTPDCIDQCAGDDSIDSDGDGVPDNCDASTCASPNNNKSASIDTDGDGLFNNCDTDSDNDGIPDTIEDTNGDGDPNNDDQDGDGVPNYLDLDSDNDGILDLYESGLTLDDINNNGGNDNGVLNGQNPVSITTPRDTDGDGVPDYLDLDSDNDGIKDLTESGFTGLVDANNDGVVDGPDADNDGIQDSADGNDGAFGTANLTTPRDTDGDGAANYRDLDSDNDGIKDLTESGRPDLGTLDANNDGVLDGADADGDGIRDNVDTDDAIFGSPETITFMDTDSDTVPNYLDLDSDNDGIKDLYESGLTGFTDANNDGVADGPDADNDGIQDSVDSNDAAFGSPGTAPQDADGDTVPNYLDLDSDNDGIKDLTESGLTGFTDANNDGVVDGPDADKDGIQDSVDSNDSIFGSLGDPAPLNTDGDTVPNYLDLDSDNDGIKDLTESGITGATDANNDGVVDGPDADNDGIQDSVDSNDAVFGSPGVIVLTNTDGDAVPNYIDLDSDNDGIKDLTESGITGFVDANNDGVVDGPDADNDGIQDSVDSNDAVFGSPGATVFTDTDSDTVPNYLDLDSDNDGIKDLYESGLTGFTDANNDGVVDGPDADNDGIQDSADSDDAAFGSPGTGTPIDSDGDSVPDVRDLDSDNDGINDIVENGNPAVVDANGDGMVDGVDNDKDGILGGADTNDGVFGSPGSPAPVNSDNDPLPNFQDLDSDNDSVSDLVESGQTGYTDSPEDGVVDGPDTDGDGIQDSVDGAPNTFGDANSPAPQDSDPGNNDGPDYIDTDSDGDGTNDIVENGNGGLDGDNNGMVDGPINDPDNDGIANNGGLDEKPNDFGGLSQAAGTPDLTPLIFSNASTYVQGNQRDVVIRIFNIGDAATSGPVSFEISKIQPAFTIAIDPNATSSTVTGQTTVNNTEWTITEQAGRYLITLNNGLSIPANGNKAIVIQVTASGTTKAQANITALIFTGTGGETNDANNSSVYRISIQ